MTKEVHYVYAGNVVVQERDQNNLPQVSYTRGNDLSGTLEGAGGIGGLLARTDNSKLNLSDPFATAVYHADGNGNVTALIYTNATLAAKYLYDPYGNTLAQSGPLAAANAYRFSSKEWDENAGLYYYLYRFYDPNLQRWPNRDPFGEQGLGLLIRKKTRTVGNGPSLYLADSPNLYVFVENSPIVLFDKWGFDAATCAGCWNTYRQQEDEIPQDYSDCLEHVESGCKWAAWLGEEAVLLCEDAGIAGCGALAIAEQDAATATLAGCLSGCQPSTCPAPPPPPPPPIPCSTCHHNNPPVVPF